MENVPPKSFVEEVAALAEKHGVKIINTTHDGMIIDGPYEACEAFMAEYTALSKKITQDFEEWMKTYDSKSFTKTYE